MSENGTRTTTRDAVARAMEASKDLLDAAARARHACLEACQETVLGLPGVQEAGPVDWSLFAPQTGFGGGGFGGGGFPGGGIDADELIAASKRVCLECVDSYEQAVLRTIELRERIVETTNRDWLRSLASTGFAVERDVTKAYVSTVRGLLE